MSGQDQNELLWQEVIARAGREFQTEKGKPFSYQLKPDKSGQTGGDLLIEGKRAVITRSTVLLAFHRAMELQEQHGFVSKPGKIGVYGDKWLYPVFLDIGICTRTKDEQIRKLTDQSPAEEGQAVAFAEADTEAGEEMGTDASRPKASPEYGELPAEEGQEAAFAEPDADNGRPRICPSCGYTTTEDFAFCPKCGEKMRTVEA